MPQAELGHCWLQGQAAEWAALVNPPLCCQPASRKLRPSLPRRRHQHQQGQPQPPSSSQTQPLCSRFAHCEFREVLAALLGAAGRLLQPPPAQQGRSTSTSPQHPTAPHQQAEPPRGTGRRIQVALTGKAPGPSLSICLESSFSKPKNREIQYFSCLEARPRRQRGFAGVQSCAAEFLYPLSSRPKGFFAPSSCPREEDASCTPGSLSCPGGSQHSPLVAPHVPAAATAAVPGDSGAEDAPDISGGGSPLLGHPKLHQPQPHASWAQGRRSCTRPLLFLAAVERSCRLSSSRSARDTLPPHGTWDVLYEPCGNNCGHDWLFTC